MTKKEWQKIMWAKELFGLGDSATLAEIKLAHRSYSKLHHPDLAGNTKRNQEKMLAINEAYQTLLSYCENFSYPLSCDERFLDVDDDEWWMNRFGQDPLWGKKDV